MSDRLNRRSRRSNRAPGSPDPSDLQELSSSPSDLATPPRNDSQNAARSQDNFGNALHVDTTDNQTDDRSELALAESRMVSDEISPLHSSSTTHRPRQTFTDADILPLNLGSPPRTVVSPESLGRDVANRITPQRRLRLPNTATDFYTLGSSSQSAHVLDSEASLQTNLQRLTITGRARRLSEQGLPRVDPPSPSEHQRLRYRHLSGSTMSTSQQQQLRHLNQFHDDSLLTFATQLGAENSRRLERRRHFTGSPMSGNIPSPNRPLNSENNALINFDRSTIGGNRRLPENLNSDQQPFHAETQRRRRRHFTGSPRSAAHEQHSMHPNEQLLRTNDVIVSNLQYPHNDEFERPERRRHSLESHMPGSLQIVNLDQILSRENDSVMDSVHPSEPLQQHDYRCERHRSSGQGDARMDQSAISSNRNKRPNDENMPPYHECHREGRWEKKLDVNSLTQRAYSPPRTRQTFPHHCCEQLSPKRQKSKHQEQSSVTPKKVCSKVCSSQLREEPLQDIQNINSDQSELCSECQRITAERERNILMHDRFRVLLRDSIDKHSNRTSQPLENQESHILDEPTELTVPDTDTNSRSANRQLLRAERLSTSEEFCHPLRMDEYYEEHERAAESSHQSSLFGDEDRYYSVGQEEHHYSSVEAEHHLLHSVEEEHQNLVEEEPHSQLGLELPRHAVAEGDEQHLLEEVQHMSSENEKEYRNSNE